MDPLLLKPILHTISDLARSYSLIKQSETRLWIAKLNHEHQKELAELRAKAESAMQDRNFERQKELQLQLKGV